jgi:hypothetical protein
MIRFKRKLLWLWDRHLIIFMTPEEHFIFMELKYGQEWLDFVDRDHERRFWT